MESQRRAAPQGTEELALALRRERIVRRSWWLHLPIYPVLVAAVVYPTVTGHMRFVHHPLDGPDAILRTAFAVGFVLLAFVVATLRGEAPPAYDGLPWRDRAVVDEALRDGTPPPDPVLRQITLERAVEAIRRRRRRARQLTAAGLIILAAGLCATTWWAAVLWMLPAVVVLVHHRRSARFGRVGQAYLRAQGAGASADAPIVAVNSYPLANRVEALTFAEPFRDIRGTVRQGTLTQELARELHPRHALAGRRWEVVAESDAGDDVVAVSRSAVVVVHLTWNEQTDPAWPTWSRAGTIPHDNASHGLPA